MMEGSIWMGVTAAADRMTPSDFQNIEEGCVSVPKAITISYRGLPACSSHCLSNYATS